MTLEEKERVKSEDRLHYGFLSSLERNSKLSRDILEMADR